MSGIKIPWLGYSLMGLGVLLLLIPGWPYIKHVFSKQKGTILKTDNIQNNLVKQYHDGEEIHARLERAQTSNTTEQVSSEIYFEAWFADVTKALDNTDFKELWYKKKIVDYRKDQIYDYLNASELALERLKSIMKLAFHAGKDSL